MRALLTILLSLAALYRANAADWLFVDETDQGNRFYIDGESLSEEDGYKTVWIKVEIADTASEADKYVQLWKLDCTMKRLAVPSYSVYAHNGDVLESDDTAVPEWKKIRPETVTEYISDLICSGGWQNAAAQNFEPTDDYEPSGVQQALEDAAKAAGEAADEDKRIQAGDFAAEAGEAEDAIDYAAKSAAEAAEDAARYQNGDFAAEAGEAQEQPKSPLGNW